MAANLADLFEHAADAFAERVAVACGDRPGDLPGAGRAVQPAGSSPGRDGGRPRRPRRALRPQLHRGYRGADRGSQAAGRGGQHQLPLRRERAAVHDADADLVALVHDREFGPLVAAIAPDAAALRATVVIEDGSDSGLTAGPGGAPAGYEAAGYEAAGYEDALAAASPERDFGPRSGDDVYIIYTGGTTGYPKGVMWRSEDIWRTLAGGIDFATGVPMADEWEQSRRGQAGRAWSGSAWRR